MGKASEWIRNFLSGRREEKHKKNATSFSAEYPSTNKTGSQLGTPRVKRRWSFRKAARKQITHRSSMSLDSIDISRLAFRARAEKEIQQNRADNAAATKIQAAYRSYLARKALYALKGLVKLQAAVRGHLVRKQTAATLRRMHALIAIQVRARAQRIQMAEEAHHVVTCLPSFNKNFTRDDGFKRMYPHKMDRNLHGRRGVSKSISDRLNYSQIERIERGFTTYHSENLSISGREREYEEDCATARNSPQRFLAATSEQNPTKAYATFLRPDSLGNMSYGCPFAPNYMGRTESSRAKHRAQSEPKQRPDSRLKPRSNQTDSANGTSFQPDNQPQHSSSSAKRVGHENHDPRFIQPYSPTRSSHCKGDATAKRSNNSRHYKSLEAFEPHWTFY